MHIDEADKLVSLKLAEAGSLELAPGPHKVSVIVGDVPVMSTELVLASGESRQLRLGEDILRKVHVATSDQRSAVHAGESMELTVSASGAGYAWVFRSEAAGRCALAFPLHSDGTPVAPDENFVGPQRRLTFPRPDAYGAILAPTTLGPAKLYIIVTSVNDASQAMGIAGHYCDAGIAKAPEPNLKENWGMQVVSFTVM